MSYSEQTLRQYMNAAGRHVSPAVQQAVVDVLVKGLTWRRAAIANDVTESGIWRCIERLNLRSTFVDN